MATTLEDLDAWMKGVENEHLEFKEAKASYSYEDLVEYCAALANEGGGALVLGVTDKKPRRVVGTQAFRDLVGKKKQLLDKLRLRIEADELAPPEGRVLVFRIPSRPLGMPIHIDGRYLMRSGESITSMTAEMLRTIFDETGPDFTAETCPKATLADLDVAAVEDFRALWQRRSGNETLASAPIVQLLADAELISEGKVTYAALVLFGRPKALGRFLAQAELVYEYRGSDAALAAEQREEFRRGFFAFRERLWQSINARNEVQQFRDGLFVGEVPTLNEFAVREAMLNAVAHRDYRLGGSVWVRQFPRRLEIESPGGLPDGITTENMLSRQAPRNRRIAETLQKCGLVERAGQGVDRMYRESIREGKRPPDFSGTDAHHVALTLHGDVQDERFLRFLERVGQERMKTFSTQDFIALDLVHREQPVPETLKAQVRRLVDLGVVETVGRGRSQKAILAKSLYCFLGKRGEYTRKKGLDHGTNKELLAKHIVENAADGSPIRELEQVLPALSRAHIKRLVSELRDEHRIRPEGQGRAVRWFPWTAPADGELAQASARDDPEEPIHEPISEKK